MRYGYDMRKGLRFRGEPQNEGLFYFCYCSGQTKTNKPLTMYMAGVEFVWLASGGGEEIRTLAPAKPTYRISNYMNKESLGDIRTI